MGESPIWDSRTQSLLWVGLTEGVVHRLHLTQGTTRSYPVASTISGLCLSGDDEYILLLQDCFLRVDLDFVPRELVGHPQFPPGLRLNDGGVDAGGTLWAGSMASDLSTSATGSLYRLRSGQAIEEIGQVALPNGMDWSPDGRTFYLVESAAQRVSAFDFEPEEGALTRPRVFVDVSPDDGMPDGLTVDANGHVWVALWGGSAVVRYTPDGRLVESYDLPVSQVTSCCFGGPDLDLLFITTARHQMDRRQSRAEPMAGSLFVTRPEAHGKPTHAFAV